jgi:glutamate dehydrogenase
VSDEVLITRLAKLLREQPPRSAAGVEVRQLESLLRLYFRHVSPEDLQEMEPIDLLGGLVAHWYLMREREPAQFNTRVYNPDQEAHGWRCADTVVEIVGRDMPFLVDSVTWALNRRGLAIHLTLHPVLAVERDGRGQVTALHDPGEAPADATAEAVMRLHVDRQPEEALADLERAVRDVLDDVATATGDWQEMRQRCSDIARRVGDASPDLDAAAREELRAFVAWMHDDHFLFLATCRLSGVDDAGGELRVEPGSGLGLLAGGEHAAERAERWIAGLGVDIAEAADEVMVTKANARSTVHRPAYMDLVAVKERDAAGRVIALQCLIGLFSSGAYHTPPRQIPLLRQKVAAVFGGAQVSPRSHSGRVVANILDTFPRDTLFQITTAELLQTTLGILRLQERQRTRLFIVCDPFRRFYSCLVYLPRDRYNRDVRLAMQEILVEALGGSDVIFETHFSESILARVYFVIVVEPGRAVDYDAGQLERRIIDVATSWHDGLRAALYEQVDEALATRYLQDYARAFPSGYRDDWHPRIAVNDILRIEQALSTKRLGVHLYHPIADGADELHVRLYAPAAPIPLSRIIPVLEHMGLSVHGERPYRIRHPSGEMWIHDFLTHRPPGAQDGGRDLDGRFTETLLRVWDGLIDDDGFNGLVLLAGLTWKQALLLRAYSRYQHQIRVQYTQDYMVSVLNRHPVIVGLLCELFARLFDPDGARDAHAVEAIGARFEALLNDVVSLDEDAILRRYRNLIEATLRTNYFQRDARGEDKVHLSFKLDPRRVEGMPRPLPMYEIFVFAKRMEGVHLRGGPVARGGLRWSDRMEDYRTEILGLMKAQMVKNTVIVPVGSKGGFVVKDVADGDSRDLRQEKGIAAYQTLLRGMLDLTDNRDGDRVVPPPRVVRRDADDPYLVVAADKGTATFSDIANRVSAEYGFWLGDAFASGGSAGYDHKAMGITARGAWESVKRHFRELGTDIQREPFTVAGIGDMSGDVFGNGMLLSRRIRLLAAFNHRHIFIDPDPDPEVSFRERERLFALPRSAWSDYDTGLISRGGGVYSRTAKWIDLEPEARQLLGLNMRRVTPNALIRAILRAPVDLLWNGGIGTYVKCSQETHAQAYDKANDDVRVDADELRCRVVGEGGNLGFTQRARVEFALHGGLVYTDAIDNSAGVDCSDHEVNIKILLDRVVADGDMTLKQRNQLLVDMTEDVAALVLRDNYAQTQAISMVASDSAERLSEHARFIDLLEQRGVIDRELEGLPGKKALHARIARQQGLTRPEIAVLHAYSKMTYFEAVTQSDIPDSDFVVDRLVDYFPAALRDRFAERIRQHRLRREIVATVVAGVIPDRVGPGIGFRVREETGTDIANVARAYLVASAIFSIENLCGRIERLDNQVAAAVQVDMLASVARFVERVVTALVQLHDGPLDMQATSARFRDGVCGLWADLPETLADDDRRRFDERDAGLRAAGVPAELARDLAGLPPMAAALDVVAVAERAGVEARAASWVYSALNPALHLDWVGERVQALGVQTHWHLLARTRLQSALLRHRRDLAERVLQQGDASSPPAEMLAQWQQRHEQALKKHDQAMAEFKAGNVHDFAIMSLAVGQVGDLVAAS